MSIVGSLFDAGTQVAELPLRGSVALIDAGLEAEQRTRAALRALAGRIALDALDAVLAEEVIDRVLERVEAAGVAQRVAARILQDGIAEQVTALLLQSEELWLIVDEVARSPSVTEAISHQSVSFMDQIAENVRERSRDADTWVQSAARRLHRRHRIDTSSGSDRGTPLPNAGRP